MHFSTLGTNTRPPCPTAGRGFTKFPRCEAGAVNMVKQCCKLELDDKGKWRVNYKGTTIRFLGRLAFFLGKKLYSSLVQVRLFILTITLARLFTFHTHKFFFYEILNVHISGLPKYMVWVLYQRMCYFLCLLLKTLLNEVNSL